MLIGPEKSKIYENILVSAQQTLGLRRIYHDHIIHNKQCLYTADILSNRQILEFRSRL